MDGLPYERDAELADVIREAIAAHRRDRNERDVVLADRLEDRANELHDRAAELRGRNGE